MPQSGCIALDGVNPNLKKLPFPWVNGRLWVHETPTLEVIFVALTDKWHPEILEISTTPEIAVETHFYVGHGNETISVFLPADGKASYLLATSNFGILNIGWYSAIRKHLFLS